MGLSSTESCYRAVQTTFPLSRRSRHALLQGRLIRGFLIAGGRRSSHVLVLRLALVMSSRVMLLSAASRRHGRLAGGACGRRCSGRA